MIQSTNEKHVYYVFPGMLCHKKTMEGGWYYMDETEDFGGGPYPTEKEAIDKLNEYVIELYRGINDGTI